MAGKTKNPPTKTGTIVQDAPAPVPTAAPGLALANPADAFSEDDTRAVMTAEEINESLRTGGWLSSIGGKVVHSGGALPPLFPEGDSLRPGDARVVRYLGWATVPAERNNGGEEFEVLNFAVLDPKTGRDLFNAQMPLVTVLREYFGLEGETPADYTPRQVEDTPPLIIVYETTLKPKTNGRNGAKMFSVHEIRQTKVEKKTA